MTLPMTLTLDSQGQTLNCMCLKWSDQWTRNRGKIYCWVICLIYKLIVELASDLYPELGFGQTQIPNWSVVCISCMICFIHDLNLQHRIRGFTVEIDMILTVGLEAKLSRSNFKMTVVGLAVNPGPRCPLLASGPFGRALQVTMGVHEVAILAYL